MPRVLVICFTDLKRDPRPYRQLQWLAGSYEVCAVGCGDPQLEGVEFLCAARDRHNGWNLLAAKAYRLVHLPGFFRGRFPLAQIRYWTPEKIDAYDRLASRSWDLIVANELSALPLAVALKKKSGGKILFDAHEYEPGHETLGRRRWLPSARDGYLSFLLRQCLAHVDARMTVCDALAEEYGRNFGGSWDVVTNAPRHESCVPSAMEDGTIRLIHHGGTNPTRRIDYMIRLMAHLDDRFTLDLMLVPKPSASAPEYRQIVALAAQTPRVRLRPPAPMTQIAATINAYDMGLILLPPVDFSYRMALPNKLFEYIQGRLAVASWPSPEIARFVRQHDCGVIAEDFTLEAMADKLNRLTAEDIRRFKRNSHAAAPRLCAEENGRQFRDLVGRLLSRSQTVIEKGVADAH